MVLIQKGRAWRLFFAVTVTCVFAGYSVFWRHTFANTSSAGTPVVSENCGTCREQPSLLFSEDEEIPIFDGTSSDGGRLSADKTQGSRKRAETRYGRGQKIIGAPLGGPYSLAVRQSLRGILLPDFRVEGSLAGRSSRRLDGTSLGDSFPFSAPTYGYMTSGFGVRRSPFHGRLVQHKGVDFAVPYGADVYATADGEVAFAGWYGGLGRTVTIDHGGGLITRYAHTSNVVVNEGDLVRRGEVIAKAGNSGRSTGTHLHYEVWLNGRALDPMDFLGREDPEALVALHDQSQTNVAPALAEDSVLGLAMGGDGASFRPHEEEPLARYNSHLVYKNNLLILGIFVSFAIGLTVHVFRHEPRLGSVRE